MKDTIRQLNESLTRLVMAGAHLAAADPDLGPLRQTLERAAPKSPVLGQIAAMLAGAASGEAAATSELLSAVTAVTQVRAAQVTLAECPPGEPLSAAPALGTPCDTRELYEIVDALTHSGAGRETKIRAALERGDIADLRLVEAVAAAVANAHLGRFIAQTVAPALGEAIVGPIRQQLDLKGGRTDAGRLFAIVAVDKAKAKELVQNALREGSVDVREAAIDAIAHFLTADVELEGIVRELAAADRASSVRNASLRALSEFESTSSLLVLADHLQSGSLYATTASYSLTKALARTKDREVIGRLVVIVDTAIANGKLPEGTPALAALVSIDDARIRDRAVAWIKAFGEPAMRAVLASAGEDVLAQIAQHLFGNDHDTLPVAAHAAMRLPRARAFEILSPAFTATDRTSSQGLARLGLIADVLTTGADGRWPGVLAEALATGTGEVRVAAATALGKMGDARGASALMEMVEARPLTPLNHCAMPRLAQLCGVLAIEPILDCLAEPKSSGHVVMKGINTLMSLESPAVIEAVRARIAAGASDPQKDVAIFKYLLQQLQDRSRGH